MKYNKLVRDKIPELIKSKGENPAIHLADESEYNQKLLEKLKEEVEEYSQNQNKEELADILEVIDAIIDNRSIDRQDLELIKENKKEERGAFKNRIILERIDKNSPKLFTATKAFIKNKEGKILILQESSKYEDGSNSGKFDVPGGRIEPGQNFEESLLREIKEETGLNVKINNPFHVGEWRPIVRDEQWHIVGTFFICELNSEDSNEIRLSQDHSDYKWISPSEHKQYDLIENLIPAFESYLKLTFSQI